MGKVKIWEASLLVALCVSLCCGVVAQSRQARLSEGIIRVHVIAQSDEAEEQAVKMQVRDAVTEYLAPIMERCQTPEQARQAVESSLDGIERAASASAQGREVSVDFGLAHYDTRVSQQCTLPAGVYSSLRVTIGEGAGHNWWGVIFPQLTGSTAAQYETAVQAIGEDNVSLITENGGGVVVRFKLLEWLDAVRAWFGE
jgi:stage II sporulation protein R